MSRLMMGVAAAMWAVLAVSCMGDTYYSESREVDPKGWEMDSTKRFAVMFTPEILDETGDFRVNVVVRNDESYAWQNLWLFVERGYADSTAVRDTVQLFLTDRSGRWTGSGVGSLHTLTEVYVDTLRVEKPGEYVFDIRHGMRDEAIGGICNVGLSVEKILHK